MERAPWFALIAVLVAASGCARGGRAQHEAWAGGVGAGAVAAAGAGEPGGGAGLGVTATSPCDRCAAQRTDCRSLFERCQADAACAALLDCVFSGRACGLDASGAACVRACVGAACAAPGSVLLFTEADRCAYCTGACGDTCSAYCGAVDHERATSCAGAAGAGGAAGHAGGAGRGGSHRGGAAGAGGEPSARAGALSTTAGGGGVNGAR